MTTGATRCLLILANGTGGMQLAAERILVQGDLTNGVVRLGGIPCGRSGETQTFWRKTLLFWTVLVEWQNRPDWYAAACWCGFGNSTSIWAMMLKSLVGYKGALIVCLRSSLTDLAGDQTLRGRVKLGLLCFTIRLADAVVAVSNGIRREAIGLGCPPERVVTIVNGGAHSTALPSASGASRRVPSIGLRVVGIGRLEAEKDWPLFLRSVEAANCYFRCQAVIAGEGSLRSDLESEIAARGLTGLVRMTGHVADVYQLFDDADVILLTSRLEGFPNVLVEALDHGVPVVAVDCPTGPSEIVIDGVNGFLVRSRNASAIAGALLRVYDRINDQNGQWRVPPSESGVKPIAEIRVMFAQLIGRVVRAHDGITI